MSYTNGTSEVPSNAPLDSRYALGLPERAKAFREVLASRLFVLVTGLTALAYLSFFKYLDFATNSPVMAASSYFVLYYSLIAVSSVLMGLNVYSLHSRLAGRRIKAKATIGSSSASASLFGGVISCSCHTSLLLPLLSSVGLSAISGIGIISALVEYQFWILATFIALQLYLAYRVLGNIQHRKPRAEGETL